MVKVYKENKKGEVSDCCERAGRLFQREKFPADVFGKDTVIKQTLDESPQPQVVIQR